ncbi:MAG: hypothetical protein K0U93_03445 [Gammaproteobacteria bacterium]|nr:hypothetical protein [Gammaproteobacteria bacterium]
MIAPEGRFIVVCAAGAAVVATAWGGFLGAAPLWLIAGGLAYLFVEPRRRVSNTASQIASPVDGIVEAVAPVTDPWLQRDALHVVIKISFPGVLALRSPIDGKVAQFWTKSDEADFLPSPTCYALALETDRGQTIVVAVESTHRHSRFKSDVAPGERVGKGLRYSFVYLASRAELYLPAGSEAQVAVGDRVLAGSGVLAEILPEPRPEASDQIAV